MEKEKEKQVNTCKGCGKILPPTYEKEYCPNCEEMYLFDAARDYVRAYDVNEYDVAEHFNIPVRVVKQWIKDGRMEYKENGKKNANAMYCSRCGAKVNFGTLCPKCLKLLNGENHVKGFGIAQKQEEGKMHFIDSDGDQ